MSTNNSTEDILQSTPLVGLPSLCFMVQPVRALVLLKQMLLLPALIRQLLRAWVNSASLHSNLMLLLLQGYLRCSFNAASSQPRLYTELYKQQRLDPPIMKRFQSPVGHITSRSVTNHTNTAVIAPATISQSIQWLIMGCKIYSLDLGRGKRFLCWKHSEQLWSPPSLPFHQYQGSFPWHKAAKVWS